MYDIHSNFARAIYLYSILSNDNAFMIYSISTCKFFYCNE